jgi:hypothetical protein
MNMEDGKESGVQWGAGPDLGFNCTNLNPYPNGHRERQAGSELMMIDE